MTSIWTMDLLTKNILGSMTLKPKIVMAAITLILALVTTMSVSGSGLNYANAATGGFITSTGPYIKVANPGNSSVTAIITDGDVVGSYAFAKIPDGIGFVQGKDPIVKVFVSHELNNGTDQGGFAKVSRIGINKTDLHVLDGQYLINGPTDGTTYKRFCSATMAKDGSFKDHPIFFANEEEDATSKVIAVDAKTSAKTELPWMGFLAHENTLDVPYFNKTAGKSVLLTFEDNTAGKSEVYMYIANSANDALSGKGQLYVFRATNWAAYPNFTSIYYGGSIQGKFAPVTWDYHTQNGTQLSAAATAAHAFEFVRPEDGTMDVRSGHTNVLYMADTGAQVAKLGTNGQKFENGRIYKFTFTNPLDPTVATLEVMLDGDDPTAPGGSGPFSNILRNPDNLGTSKNSLMILEDRNGYNRFPVVLPYDVTQGGKVWKYDLGTGSLKPVAYVDQSYDSTNPKYGEWESSGIVDASSVFGIGTWLVDVQAHTLHEGGQLLVLKVNGS
jgi:hypothetical protein